MKSEYDENNFMGTNLGDKKKNWIENEENDENKTLMGVDVSSEDIGHNSTTYGEVEMMGVVLTSDAASAIESGFDGRSYPISRSEIYGEE